MPINLEWDSVVADKTVDNGGFVGDLMKTARAHISDAVSKNEITQAQAGEVYTAMIPAAFQAGLEFALKEQVTEAQAAKVEAETSLLTTQQSELTANGAKDRAMKDSQTALYARQTAGFDDNKNQKLFEAQLNSWGLMYSSGTLTEIPSIISNDAVSTLYSTLTS